ncbi:hypothetical protein ACSLBF_17065 [Pseudoalteromonas sp. T1lg65]|uniref:hypothetical protein n=1 Tax=Pseudoalteromonas sp. T1lg65 TaxID=2077101 RepID=UPI003F7AF9E0
MRNLDLNELQKVSGGDKDSDACYRDGKKYSDGARVVLADGTSQVCQGGIWQESEK